MAAPVTAPRPRSHPEAACIRVLVTGGTFDKHYDPIRGELTFRNSHLPTILKLARIAVPISLEILHLMDSLEMNDSHRERILDACDAAPEDRIIIIHGTDTMSETARLIGKANLPKTIVLTGAMIPCSVNDSDAHFNMGFAMAAVQTLCPQTYVAMNGSIFPWDKVRKNRQDGVFEEILES
jgi:L-asparaginase